MFVYVCTACVRHYVELVKDQVQVLLSMMDVVFGIDGCIDTMKG